MFTRWMFLLKILIFDIKMDIFKNGISLKHKTASCIDELKDSEKLEVDRG